MSLFVCQFSASRASQGVVQVVAPPAQEKKSMDLTARIKSVSMELLTSTTFTPIIKAEMSDLSTKYQMKDGMNVDLVLKSFTVADTQPSSKDNAIKKLICPKAGLQEEEEEDEVDKEEGIEKALLRMTVKEETGDNPMYDVDMVLEDFTLNVLVGSLLATVDVALENTNAVLELIGDNDSGESPVRDPGSPSSSQKIKSLGPIDEDHEEEVAQDSGKSDGPPIGLNVKLRLLNPGLILVENPRNYDSRTISLRSTFIIHYVRTTEVFTIVESIHIDASRLESFVDIITGSTNPLQIVEPLALGVHVKRRTEGDKLLTSDLAFNLSTLDARVAYNDVMLVATILSGLSDANAKFQEAQKIEKEASRRNSSISAGRSASDANLIPAWDQEGTSDGVTQIMPGEAETEKKDTSINRAILSIPGVNVS